MITTMDKDTSTAIIEPTNNPRSSKSRSSETSLQGPTGPRTQRGKQKARYNAVKHGLFHVGLVRGLESKAEFARLVEELVETLQPAGRLEEILVEKLAMLVWRYRRLLRAEAAEIAGAAESASHGNVEGKTQTAAMLAGEYGLAAAAILFDNEVALAHAIGGLKELRARVNQRGLDWNEDKELLKRLYGTGKKKEGRESMPNEQEATPADDPDVGDVKVVGEYAGNKQEGTPADDPDPACELVRKYRDLASAQKNQDTGGDSPADAAKEVLNMITERIITFMHALYKWDIRNREITELKTIAALVPRQEVADRFQRFEASLERAFDRTLVQLERLQRIRMGHPVPPPLKVELSR